MFSNKRALWACSAIAAGIIGAVLAGCSTSGEGGATTQPAVANTQHKSGVQLWQENCARCHNMISPDRYGDSQWTVVVRVMRVRAGLTSDQENAILDFLKSAD